MRRYFCLGIVCCFWLATSGAARGETLRVFAAASLKNVLFELTQEFEAESGFRVRPVLAGTPTLARQIRYGAKADIFIAANSAWMDFLQRQELIDKQTRFDLVKNRLVLVAHKENLPSRPIDKTLPLKHMLGEGRLAVALTRAVPAGIYARASLTRLGLWAQVKDRLVETDNVRAALTLARRGAVPLAIVYASDVFLDDGVGVVGTFPAHTHPPIVYPAAAVLHAEHKNGVRAFLSFLKTPLTQKIFKQHGFQNLE